MATVRGVRPTKRLRLQADSSARSTAKRSLGAYAFAGLTANRVAEQGSDCSVIFGGKIRLYS